MSRLLWHSNAPWSSTGYGQQTALFAQRLNEHHTLAISAFYGLEGNIVPWNGIPVLPGIGGRYGNESIREHAKMFFGGDLRGGTVLTLMDVWVLDPRVWEQMNVCCWVPVDHEPAPDPVAGFLRESGAVPIAMSRFGRDQLANAGLSPLYVPHAIDTSVYKPIPKGAARSETAIPEEAFVVGMVAANKGNPSRKCFVEAFQAFKALHDRHSDARLYLHTEATGLFDGVNLSRLLDAVGLPHESILICDQYRAVHRPFTPEQMAKVFSSLDVLLMPSAGEGFGIPALEAQACGVPVIGSDFSAQREVIAAGWLVGGRKVYTPISSWQFLPDPEEIAQALERAYSQTSVERESLSKKARKHALTYDIDTVMEKHMLPALATVEERFAERPVELVPEAA